MVSKFEVACFNHDKSLITVQTKKIKIEPHSNGHQCKACCTAVDKDLS